MLDFTFVVHDFDPTHDWVTWRVSTSADIGWISSGYQSLSGDEDTMLTEYFEDHPLTRDQRRTSEGKIRPVARWHAVLRNGRCVVKLVVTEMDEQTGGLVLARVSFNPARLHDPDGWGLCPLNDARTYVQAVLCFLEREGIVTRLCPHTDAKIQGSGPSEPCVDLACLTGRQVTTSERRRFNIRNEESWADHLRGVRIQRIDLAVDFRGIRRPDLWHRVVMAHAGTASPGPGTSSLLTGGWNIRLYDKGRQAKAARTGVPVAAPTHRLEVQVRRQVLRRRGVDWPADLTENGLVPLFVEGMAKVGLDRIVGGVNRRGSGPTLTGIGSRTRRVLFDRLNMYAARGAYPPTDPKTARKYRRLAEQCGYVAGHRADEPLGRERVLDLLTGRETRPSAEWKTLHGAGRYFVATASSLARAACEQPGRAFSAPGTTTRASTSPSSPTPGEASAHHDEKRPRSGQRYS